MLKLRLLTGTAATVLAVSVGIGAATARADDDHRSGYGGGYYSGHVRGEQEHMSGERHHMRHERRARDEALRHGDWWGAWNMQQHLNREGHHLRREREHVGHEMFDHH